MARPLEDRFPPPHALPDKIDGIIVLGGLVSDSVADRTGLLTIGDSAERIMIAAALARRHPESRLVITGRGEDHPTMSAWLSG